MSNIFLRASTHSRTTAVSRTKRAMCIFDEALPMRLFDYTDYTVRVMMYCAAHPNRLVTIAEMADR